MNATVGRNEGKRKEKFLWKLNYGENMRRRAIEGHGTMLERERGGCARLDAR